MQFIRPATMADAPSLLQFIANNNLPTAGVTDHIKNFLVIEDDMGLMACAALEHHQESGLLRSVVVRQDVRGCGIATKMVLAVLQKSQDLKLRNTFLLTETAENYFPRFGFEKVLRENLPQELFLSQELRGACPDSAIAMQKKLR